MLAVTQLLEGGLGNCAERQTFMPLLTGRQGSYPLAAHLQQLSCGNVPHLDYASLTAAHDVGLADPGSQDGIFVFKCLQALPRVYVPF